MAMILPELISIQNQIPHCAKFALPPDFFVGILNMAATGIRLKQITLMSAKPYSQNGAKSFEGFISSSINITSLFDPILYCPSIMLTNCCFSSLSVIIFLLIENLCSSKSSCLYEYRNSCRLSSRLCMSPLFFFLFGS